VIRELRELPTRGQVTATESAWMDFINGRLTPHDRILVVGQQNPRLRSESSDDLTDQGKTLIERFAFECSETAQIAFQQTAISSHQYYGRMSISNRGIESGLSVTSQTSLSRG
jgi:hypothetical protein